MKRRLVLLTLVLVVSLSGGAAAQVQPCLSTAFLGGASPACLMSCPRGDGLTPADAGWFMGITVIDVDTLPMAGIPATDIWLDECIWWDRPILPCGGPIGASSADGPTDAAGSTMISTTTFAVSGCGYLGSPLFSFDAVRVFVQGEALAIRSGPDCSVFNVTCKQVRVRSADVTNDGVVGLPDLSLFAMGMWGAYDICVDFTCDGVINLVDLSLFAPHLRGAHGCP